MTGVLITGCSNENSGNEAAVKVRNSETVGADVEKTSSRILEMLAVKGKVTETGAMTSPCTDHGSDEKVFRARHPWSVHQAPFAEMQKGMERLRRELPKDGWEIVKDGPDSSTAKSPQLVAESAGREFAVDVRLHRASKVGNAPDLLEVTVESACYRSE
ncbi:hypothetical protein ACIRFF_06550 [Streptomyces cyaneofuscatus]|uniref:hypothetical protein n=1 Tax=Streptomyces sp. ME02-6991-2A TaxID=3028677 RepID=UPI00211AC3CD|nr:hypothetical protein [Streptomyces sp. ME02-6991-2A]MDX3376961.1 hypothetical protein [Streptomyces sp. ME02-6991-2A]